MVNRLAGDLVLVPSASGGVLVTCGAHAGEVVPLDVVNLFQHGWRIAGFRIAPPDELRAAVDLIRTGKVKVPVDKTFPLSQAAEAHRHLDRQQHVGKVLLTGQPLAWGR